MSVGDVRLVGQPDQSRALLTQEVDKRAADECVASGDEGAHHAASVGSSAGRTSSLNTRRRVPRARSAAS